MKRALPARPSLEHLKSQAKDLLEAFRRGDASARERFRDALPAVHGASDEALARLNPALHDAHSVLAREYGYRSFVELKAAVERAAAPPEYLRDLMQRHMNTPPPDEVVAALHRASADLAPDPATLPPELPVLPLRNAVLTVGALAPLSVARPPSLRAVEKALAADGWLGIFTQKSIDNEAPSFGDLYTIGVGVKLMATLPHEAGLWIIVRAAMQLELRSLSAVTPYLAGVTARFEIQSETGTEIASIERALRERLRVLAAALPNADELTSLVETLEAPDLADAAVANLPAAIEEKARYLSEARLIERLRQALALAERAASS